MTAVSGICSIVCIVCWIMTLIKLFQNEGILQGVFGIICGLYAFIMGFVRMNEWDHGKVMAIWALCMVLSIVASVVGGIAAAPQM